MDSHHKQPSAMTTDSVIVAAATGKAGHPEREEEQFVRLGPGQMLLAYVSGAFGFTLQTMGTFLVPLRAHELGAPMDLIGLIVGAGALVPALLSVPAGALADSVGARRAYMIGTFSTAMVTLLLAAATDYWALLGLQLIFGFTQNIGWVAAQTYITSVGSRAERAAITGRFSFSSNVGIFLGPSLAGVAAQMVGYQSAFLFFVVVALAFTAIGLALPEVKLRDGPMAAPVGASVGFGAALELLRLRGVQVAMFLTFVRLWTWSGWSAFYPLFLVERGYPPALVGTIISSSSLVSTVSALGAGRLSRLATKEIVTAGGLAIGAAGTLLSPLVAVAPWVYLPPVLLGLGIGISLPLLMAIVSEHSPSGRRGVALGLRTSANRAASTVSPIAVGAFVTSLGTTLGFALSAVVAWLVLVTAIWLHLGHRRLQRPQA